MRKNVLFYIIATALIVLSVLSFNQAYQEMLRYSALTNRSIIVYRTFQNLSREVNNAAIITPEMMKEKARRSNTGLFYADSVSVTSQLNQLQNAVLDSINTRLADQISRRVRSELTWMLSSNVIDSMIHHRSSPHISALKSIDSMINKGIARTNFLFQYRQSKLEDSIGDVKQRILIFMTLAGLLLIFTTINLLRQLAKRQQKEEELQKQEHRFRDTLENMMEGVQIIDFNWRYIYVNDALSNYSSYAGKELIGHTVMEKYPGVEQTELYAVLKRCMEQRIPAQLQSGFTFPNGVTRDFELSVQPVPEGIFILSVDITERKKAEKEITKLNRLYAFISNINQSIVHINDEPTLLDKACKIATGVGGFKTARIDMLDENGNLKTASVSGDPETLKKMDRSGSHTNPVLKHTPSGKALESGKYEVNNDMLNDPALSAIREQLSQYGILSAVSLPIKKLGTVVGVFSLGSSQAHFFDSQEIDLLVEAAGDISFALEIFEKNRQHRLTEELVIMNERRFRALIEKSTDMKTLTSEDGLFVYVSPSVSKTFGFSEEEFLNQPAALFFHPDDLPDLFQKRQEILGRPGASFEFHYRIRHKNGSWIWCEGTLTNLLHEPAINALVSNFKDISERKNAEEQKQFDNHNLNALINNTNDLLWSIDRDFRLITFNRPFFEAIKASTGKELQNGDSVFSVVLSPEQEDRFRDFYARALAGESFTEIDVIEGTVNYAAEISFYPIRRGHEIIGTACYSRDITERRKAEKEREKMISDLVRHTKNLEQFAYVVSHNLRSPVAHILGISNILKGELSETDRARSQQFMHKAVEQLDIIVKDLNKILEVRAAVGQNKEEINLKEVLEGIKISIHDSIERENVSFVEELEVVRIRSFKSYIYSIFYNLITNSIKYRSREREPVIRVSSCLKDGKIILRLRDNGDGMDLELYGDKVFGLYQRFHLNISGKGLGLFMVKTQVEALEGKISLSSAPQQGTEFTIELPE